MNNLGRAIYEDLSEKERETYTKVVLARSKVVGKRNLKDRYVVFPQLSIMKVRGVLGSYSEAYRCPLFKLCVVDTADLKSLPLANDYKRDFLVFSYVCGWSKSNKHCTNTNWKPKLELKNSSKEVKDKINVAKITTCLNNMRIIATKHPLWKDLFLEDYKTWCKLIGKTFKENECWDYFLDLSREKC